MKKQLLAIPLLLLAAFVPFTPVHAAATSTLTTTMTYVNPSPYGAMTDHNAYRVIVTVDTSPYSWRAPGGWVPLRENIVLNALICKNGYPGCWPYSTTVVNGQTVVAHAGTYTTKVTIPTPPVPFTWDVEWAFWNGGTLIPLAYDTQPGGTATDAHTVTICAPFSPYGPTNICPPPL